MHKFDEDVFEYNVPFSNISAYMLLLMVTNKKYDDEDRVYNIPREAMIVGTSLTEMKRDTLSMIPSRAHPKLRMSAGKSSPGQDCWRICNCDSYSIGRGMSYVYRFFLIFHEQINCRALSKQV